MLDMQGRKSRHRQILYRVRHTFCVKVPIMRSRESAASKVLRSMLESNRNTTGGFAGRVPAITVSAMTASAANVRRIILGSFVAMLVAHMTKDKAAVFPPG